MTNRADVPLTGSILDLHGERCENGCRSSVAFVLAGRHVCAECYLRYTNTEPDDSRGEGTKEGEKHGCK